MDPTQALTDLLIALADGQRDEADLLLLGLHDWIDRQGGFLPNVGRAANAWIGENVVEEGPADQTNNTGIECENCDSMNAKERSLGDLCDDCYESGGYVRLLSDHEERMAERRQMGLSS